ncbi:hypothetical protein GCM10008967_29980 [Bacillus carboniphilus]|uniref:Uncharacterized protein n=1 Tax=Bacillus carboniphilus TaxID=86663 RepID=A0ABP3G9I2_9BACI
MEEYKGYRAYNEEDFLNHFTARRGRPDSPNNAIEGPMIYEMLDLREGTPKMENFSSKEEYFRRRRIPVVLGFSYIK